MPAIRTSNPRHPIVSENTPPDLSKRLNTRLSRQPRTALTNKKRGASNIFPPSLRSGVYPAEQVKRRESYKSKIASTVRVAPPAANPSKYESGKPSSSKRPDPSPEPEIPETINFKIPLSTDRPLDVERKDPEFRTFPRRLQRPPYRPVSREAIMASAPETELVPDTYTTEMVSALSKEWFPDLAKVDISFDKSNLPSTYDVRVTAPKVAPPTHILAVRPMDLPTNANAPKPCPVQLYPVHSMVMAFHCRNLPPFSPSESGDRVREYGEQITVPSRYLCLPSPQSFPIILKYLYTQDKSAFLQTLLSAPPPPNVVDGQYESIRGFGTRLGLSAKGPEHVQMTIFSLISVWKNTVALGIVDDAYWECLDIAWEAILCAYAVATGQPEVMGLVPR